MMKERLIVEALQKATIAAVAASINPALPLKILGRPFNIPNDGKYLEMVYIPNNITNEFWGNEKTYRGLFRLILHWGVTDEGIYPPLDLLASICSHFVKGSSFTNGTVSVKIYEQPDLTGPVEGSPETLYPVSIRYMCFDNGKV